MLCNASVTVNLSRMLLACVVLLHGENKTIEVRERVCDISISCCCQCDKWLLHCRPLVTTAQQCCVRRWGKWNCFWQHTNYSAHNCSRTNQTKFCSFPFEHLSVFLYGLIGMWLRRAHLSRHIGSLVVILIEFSSHVMYTIPCAIF